MRPAALILATAALAGTLTVALIISNQRQRIDRLDQRTRRIVNQAKRQHDRLAELEGIICVLAHVPKRDEQTVVAAVRENGRLDPRDYLPDYPDCQ